MLYNHVLVGSAAASWDDYAGAVVTIGRAQAGEDTRAWLAELITDRIDGFDAEAIAAHLVDRGDNIKTTVEISAATIG